MDLFPRCHATATSNKLRHQLKATYFYESSKQLKDCINMHKYLFIALCQHVPNIMQMLTNVKAFIIQGVVRYKNKLHIYVYYLKIRPSCGLYNLLLRSRHSLYLFRQNQTNKLPKQVKIGSHVNLSVFC